MKTKILILLLTVLLVGCSSKISLEPFTSEDELVEKRGDFVLLLTDMPFEKIVEQLVEKGYTIEKKSQTDALLKHGKIHVTVVPNDMTDTKKYAVFLEK